jgi:hypothetical protein
MLGYTVSSRLLKEGASNIERDKKMVRHGISREVE